MLFQGRVDRAMKHHRKESEKRRAAEKGLEEIPESYDPKQEFEERPLKDRLEKHDVLAMLISAMGVFIPVALGVLLLLVGVSCLLSRVSF